MATVTLTNVVKRFGVFEVVHGASMDIKDGEFVVFVGPPAAENRRCSG